MSDTFVYMFACAPCACLWMVVSHHVVPGMELGPLQDQVLLTAELSLQPLVSCMSLCSVHMPGSIWKGLQEGWIGWESRLSSDL